MSLRVALGPSGQEIELTLPGGKHTLVRVEGHTGQVILRQLQEQRRAELRQLGRLGLELPSQLPEVQFIPKRSPKISGRPRPQAAPFSLDDLDL